MAPNRAKKLRFLAGMFDLILMSGSPNLTMLTTPVDLFRTYTANFFDLPGVLKGLLRVTVLFWYVAIVRSLE
jgi:hypothetical protein